MKEMLSVSEACEFLRISQPTLYRYIGQGEVPALKIGAKWLFHRESLEKWIRSQVKEGTAARKARTYTKKTMLRRINDVNQPN